MQIISSYNRYCGVCIRDALSGLVVMRKGGLNLAGPYFNRVDRVKVEPRGGFETCCFIVKLILICVGFYYNGVQQPLLCLPCLHYNASPITVCPVMAVGRHLCALVLCLGCCLLSPSLLCQSQLVHISHKHGAAFGYRTASFEDVILSSCWSLAVWSASRLVISPTRLSQLACTVACIAILCNIR